MNVIQKNEVIKTGPRKDFRDGKSKMARRKCYGYEAEPLLLAVLFDTFSFKKRKHNN